MKKMAWVKTSLFSPILKYIDQLWITPDMVSALWMICIILSAILLRFNILLSFALLVSHIIFDWLDWSLARYQKKSSNAWAFVDIIVDQSGIIILTLAFIFHNISDPFWTSTYLVTYILMIVFLIYSNTLDKPIPFVIRTKYIVFVWLLLLYFMPNYWYLFYDILFKTWSVYQLWVITYLFFSIRWALQ